MDDLLPNEATRRRTHSQVEIDTMRKFCEEYQYDQDPVNAALRIGITKLYAKSVADEFMNTEFVQLELKRMATQTQAIVSDKELLKNELIRNLLSILKKDGETVNQATRIQAAKQLADLMELNPKQQVDTNQVQHSVMIVPAPLSIDDWSQQAVAQQAELYKQLEASL